MANEYKRIETQWEHEGRIYYGYAERKGDLITLNSYQGERYGTTADCYDRLDLEDTDQETFDDVWNEIENLAEENGGTADVTDFEL
jgi:hypothetical protein